MKEITTTEFGVVPPEESNSTPATEVGKPESAPADKANADATTKTVAVDQPLPSVNYESKYKELQRAYTQETQRRAALEKQWGGVSSKLEEQAKILAELRKQPYDREKFLEEFQAKGPEVLRPLWGEDINKVKNEYSTQMSEYQNKMEAMEWKMTLSDFRGNAEAYPDFKKLEPIIAEAIDDPNCPVDFSKPKAQVVDALYQMARQTSSAEAIRQAEAEGKRKAEANLVRESKSTVTGGGKSASITQPNLDAMSVEKLREYMVQVNGVVDRD